MSLIFYYPLHSPHPSTIYRKFTVTVTRTNTTFSESEKKRLSVLFIPSNPVQPHPLQLKGYIEVGPSPLVRSPLETQIETVINRFDNLDQSHHASLCQLAAENSLDYL